MRLLALHEVILMISEHSIIHTTRVECTHLPYSWLVGTHNTNMLLQSELATFKTKRQRALAQ